MNKIAFFTMDVESFFDTSCVKEKCIPFNVDYDAEEGLNRYLSLLEEYGIAATLFLTVDTAERWQSTLKTAVKQGHKLAVHALDHEDVTCFSDEKFLFEVTEAKRRIEDRFGCEIIGYRAPCFGISDTKTELLKAAGYKYDSSALNFGRAARSGYLSLENYKKINDVVYEKDGFFEFKPCVANSVLGKIPISGGGYLRLAPRFVTRRLLAKHVKDADAYMFYVHPFELCAGRLPKYKELSLSERTFVCRGRKYYARIIRNLIEMLVQNNYDFVTMDDYLRRLVDE